MVGSVGGLPAWSCMVRLGRHERRIPVMAIAAPPSRFLFIFCFSYVGHVG